VKAVADYFGTTVDYLAYGSSDIQQGTDPFLEYQEDINAGTFEVILRRIKK
jgi:hypothetical protein